MKRLLTLPIWLAALALLHVVSLAPLPWERHETWQILARPSPDLAALLGVAVLGAAAGRPRVGAHVGAVLLLAAVLFRNAEFYVQLLLDRALDLKFDVAEVAGVVHLLTHDTVPQWLALAGAGLTLLLLELLLAWAFARVARPAQSGRGAVLLALALQALVLTDVVRASCDRDAGSWWHGSALVPLATELRHAATYWLDPESVDGPLRARLTEAAAVMAATPTDLAKLERADVHFVVVESYGRFAHRSPTVVAPLRALWRESAPALRAAGVEVVTAICRPSNTGGASWLSHAQLLSGARIDSRRAWELLLASDVQPLPQRFRTAGYRTVEVEPAMDRHWPEGQRFYGFDVSLTQLELGYRGTLYHWGRMPDQFALHHLLREVIEPAEQPLLTMYVSVTSHVPFVRVPPYVADWRIDAGTFAGPPRVVHPVSWLDVPHGPRLVEAYADTIEYSLRCAIGFTERLPRPSLVIVLGDHQPPIAAVADEPAMAADVPIHVLTNRPELLAPLRAIGFVDGWEVPDGAGVFSTAAFAPTFLRLYSRRAD